MGKTRDLFKKIRDTKGTFHAKMGTIKDRNYMDLTEAKDIKKRWCGRGVQDGEHVHPWLIHVNVWQNHYRKTKKKVARIHRTIQKRST